MFLFEPQLHHADHTQDFHPCPHVTQDPQLLADVIMSDMGKAFQATMFRRCIGRWMKGIDDAEEAARDGTDLGKLDPVMLRNTHDAYQIPMLTP